MRIIVRSAVIAAVAAISAASYAKNIDWKQVDDAMGRAAQVTGDVHRYGFPRTDLHVSLDGVGIKPALALGGWVAIKPSRDGAMMMGDLVLLEQEVSPVMSRLLASGFDITALHNHIMRAEPATFYMHVVRAGDPVLLARDLREALTVSRTPMNTSPAAPPVAIALDTAEIDRIIGAKGKAVGGVYQFGVPRKEPVTMAGMALTPPAPLGVATGINFQPTGNNKAAITGDFVLAAAEVNPVIRALHANGIEVTAIHSHMLDERPRLFFLHFWANDDAVKLAKGLHAALDTIASASSEPAAGTVGKGH